MTDYPKRLRACVTASRGIDCRDPDLLIGAADEIDWLKAENTRLNDAKRRALAIADERSRGNVALRAALYEADETFKRHGFVEGSLARLHIAAALNHEQKGNDNG